MFKFNLGDKVRDKITGFGGVVICQSKWLNGCVQYAVKSAKVSKDGKMIDSEWIDEGQLELVKAGFIRPGGDDLGGPMPNPTSWNNR